jgi:hypothetical protein
VTAKGSIWQSPHDHSVKTRNIAIAAVGDQRNLAGSPRFKPHSSSGGNIEAIAERSDSIKIERRVSLGKVIMTADLNRPGAGVGDPE